MHRQDVGKRAAEIGRGDLVRQHDATGIGNLRLLAPEATRSRALGHRLKDCRLFPSTAAGMPSPIAVTMPAPFAP